MTSAQPKAVIVHMKRPGWAIAKTEGVVERSDRHNEDSARGPDHEMELCDLELVTGNIHKRLG